MIGKKLSKILSLLLVIILIIVPLASCKKQNRRDKIQQKFNAFMEQLFVEEFEDDAISIIFF